MTVFGIAIWLNPYDAAGQPRRLETHTQLGLPPCTFRTWTGLPCPSCGMTTSFALLLHGDVGNSLKANAVGTLVATVGLLLIPWCLACAVKGRQYLVRNLDRVLLRAVVLFLVLLLGRWLIVLAMIWWQGKTDAGTSNLGGRAPADSRRRDHGSTCWTLALDRPGDPGGHPGHWL